MTSFALIVPVLNPGSNWDVWLRAFAQQTIKPKRAIVLDSESSDGYTWLAKDYGFDIIEVSRRDFNHGATRQLGIKHLDQSCDLVILMTQDAILAGPEALELIVRAFEDPMVGAAYGRQLPHKNATPLEAHARLFNYGTFPCTKSLASISELGLKTCFISNSFAAYRLKDLLAVGGFPADVILGEDAYVAGQLVLAGKKIAYVPDACVFHSHDYSIMEEFKRYFDTGVFHAQQPWITEKFGGATGEGRKFVLSELRYLVQYAPYLIPSALARTFMKLLGYRLGRAHIRLPVSYVPRLSMHRGFWKQRDSRK